MSIVSVEVKKAVAQNSHKNFPKGNLDVVTKTTTVTTKEFAQLWANTNGYHDGGNQYANMNSWDYVCALDERVQRWDLFTRQTSAHKLSNTITRRIDAGWAMYTTRCHATEITESVHDALPENFTTVFRCKSKCGERQVNDVVARRSKCGNYVTVFKTR